MSAPASSPSPQRQPRALSRWPIRSRRRVLGRLGLAEVEVVQSTEKA